MKRLIIKIKQMVTNKRTKLKHLKIALEVY